MIKHYALRINGQVQGVFFRQSTKAIADKLNISGFVRNEPDGTVYIEAEGEEKNLKKFLTWCRKGPEYAQVEKVEINELKELQNLGNFIIEW